jgi:hypothetical protein
VEIEPRLDPVVDGRSDALASEDAVEPGGIVLLDLDRALKRQVLDLFGHFLEAPDLAVDEAADGQIPAHFEIEGHEIESPRLAEDREPGGELAGRLLHRLRDEVGDRDLRGELPATDEEMLDEVPSSAQVESLSSGVSGRPAGRPTAGNRRTGP